MIGVAAMTTIDAIKSGPMIPLQPEERANAFHDSQDTNSPAGGTDRADT